MLTHTYCWSSAGKLAIAIAAAALLPCAIVARAQPPASAAHVGAKELMRQDLIGMPGKEVVMSTIEVPPGASSAPHRHDAQVFVYMLEGTMIMQVKGGPRMTLGPGQTFYENPTDIHSVSANASRTKPAKFLAILIKDKGAPGTRQVPPDQAQ